MTLVKPIWIADRQVAVVEVQADRDLGIGLDGTRHHAAQDQVVGVGAGTPAGLDDHGRAGLAGGAHNPDELLHVVDVEGWDAVVALGGVVEELA